MDKPLGRLIKKKKRRWLKSIKSEIKKAKLQLRPQKYKGSWDYYEQLHAKKMDKILEMYKFPRLNQKKIENMNSLVASNEIESVS